jgi:hypothetical protein
MNINIIIKIMSIKSFLQELGFTQISNKEINSDNDFYQYENFKKFIDEHYSLDHLQKHNYIKYVKVMRQIIKVKHGEIYDKHIKNIQNLIKIMVELRIFKNINILKYMFRLNSFFALIEEKKYIAFNTIRTIRTSSYLIDDNSSTKFKIIVYINELIYKYHILVKYSKKLIILINNLIEFEKEHGIDHKLIDLNNMERTFLGKKSEYIANNNIQQYVNELNKDDSKKYFYLTNIDLFKFLKFKTIDGIHIKGEVDGMIISFDGHNYFIEKIIEVKSSIKSTYEDYHKFILLKEYIKNIDKDIIIKHDSYTFTYNSFLYILQEPLYNWVIYICINDINKSIIEKSHFYFFTVLKIVDERFIKNYYIELNDKSIVEKYQIISENREMIDQLFDIWKENIGFGTNNCNVYFISNR